MAPIAQAPLTITICMGSSCFARGNGEHLDRLEHYAANGRVPLELQLIGTRCENRCASGPVLIVGGRRFEQVDAALLEMILKDLDASVEPSNG